MALNSSQIKKMQKLAKSGNVAAKLYMSGGLGNSAVNTKSKTTQTVTPKKTSSSSSKSSTTTKAATPAKSSTSSKSTTTTKAPVQSLINASPINTSSLMSPKPAASAKKLSFSVLPGMPAQTFSMPSSTGANSTIPYARTQEEKEKLQKLNYDPFGSPIDAATVIGTVGLGPIGGLGGKAISSGVRAASNTASNIKLWTSLLTKAKAQGTKAYTAVKNLFARGGDDAIKNATNVVNKGKTFADDAARQGANVDDLIALNRMRQVQPALNVARTVNASSNLGRIIGGGLGAATLVGTGYGAYQGYQGAVNAANQPYENQPEANQPKGTAGQIRNAVNSPWSPATGTTQTGTTPTGTTPPSGGGGSPSPITGETGAVPAYAGPSGSAAQRVVSASSLAGSGSVGGTALVGEYDTQSRTEAGARAIELQQAQSESSPTTPAMGDEVDLAALTKSRDRINELLGAGITPETRAEFKANLQQMLAAGIQNIRKIQPIPKTPVVDTEEQAQFLASIDPIQQPDIQAQMDTYRKELGMPAAEARRADIKQQMAVVTEQYQMVIDDIKANPNMPKTLAARRLTEIFNEQKFAIGQLKADLDDVEDEIDSSNTLLDRRLGIIKEEQDQAEKSYQRRLDTFGMMVDSGSVGGMSDKEIAQWSVATGIPERTIKEMKKKAVDPNKEYDINYETDAEGNLTIIYANKKDPTDVKYLDGGKISKGFAPKTSGTKEEKPQVIYTKTNLPAQEKADLVATIKDGSISDVTDLYELFPLVDEEVINEYWNLYYKEKKTEKEPGIISRGISAIKGWFD